MRKNWLFLAGTLTGVGLTLLVSGPDGAQLIARAKAAAGMADTYSQLNLFGAVFERVRADYVEKPDDPALIEGAINGMVSSLDPHSRYMNDKSWRDMQETTSGEFGGLGIEVTMEDGLVKVVAPIDDTPASKAGILSGDLIAKIDGEAVQGLTLEQAVAKMKGGVNTKTKLTIMRKGKDAPLDVTLTREIIRVRPVRYHTEGGDIGYIRITSFNEQTTESLRKAITSISKDIPQDKLAGYVVDLRNNPGGLLDQAVSVSSTFLPRGEVVSTRGRNPEETQRFTARGGDLTKGKPLVVLINGGSASASEIVAGALHDHKRATLVGTRSFGKGSVQTIIPLGAGNGALALTTARYYTPSGRSIQAQGIAPDIEVKQDVPDDLKDRTDIKGEASMRGHLSAADGTEQTGSQSYVPPDEKDDKALHAAFNVLRGVTVNADVRAKAAVPN
ncbi:MULTISPECIES: S41 family peptidase [Bradyrhizobium]|jgi:carboxyl-terminal processing protease|uniref:S41 family peptidase n=2 Tax=Bradyrhizobium TaxID=374 RepID=A0ABS5G3M3_9BRAD|nr:MULTISPECIES: S41 family peptidase [Bradyrhizobium]RTL93264.1 MAG: S41 family peptidase [Bradyrhizobiaceae bacterium]ABQ36522.1 Carboxy-terminal-processing protease precursor (C- terminal-processing protease) [Bradyrhizobium sp. BTAi1]MBR1135920.1 S41 family peptidase [Bradyrhizobium denitrificans]MCL8483590.1 S41 family peptidase [Bradyrhizobium denitrificans]MDU1492134.1 S41 family peptidase [Bradyrhizobium sp.]